jgi:hypothetical protein
VIPSILYLTLCLVFMALFRIRINYVTDIDANKYNFVETSANEGT